MFSLQDKRALMGILPPKIIDKCTECGRHHELPEPQPNVKSTWCKPCWIGFSESEKQTAVDAVLDQENALLATEHSRIQERWESLDQEGREKFVRDAQAAHRRAEEQILLRSVT